MKTPVRGRPDRKYEPPMAFRQSSRHSQSGSHGALSASLCILMPLLAIGVAAHSFVRTQKRRKRN